MSNSNNLKWFSDNIVDVYDDEEGAILKQYLNIDSVPQHIKEASNISEGTYSGRNLDNYDYALVSEFENGTLRKFATVDPGNTLLSTIYYFHNRDNLTDDMKKTASSNLVKSLNDFNLPIPEELINDANISASDIEDLEYAPPVNGRTIKMSSEPEDNMTQEDLVSEGIEFIDNNWHVLPPRDRLELSLEIGTMAKEAGVDINDKIEGFLNGPNDNFDDVWFETRKRMTDESYHDVLDVIKNSYNNGAIAEIDLADGLAGFDKEAGLVDYWGSKLEDPYTAIFWKEAESNVNEDDIFDEKWVIGNDILYWKDFDKFIEDQAPGLERVVSEDIKKSIIEEGRDALTSLPRPHQQATIRLINSRANPAEMGRKG